MVGIIFVHASGTTMRYADKEIGLTQTSFAIEFIIKFISDGVARAVPMFFLISGYLFFTGLERSKEKYFVKLKSRVKSLLVPFVFWNIFTLLIIAIVQTLPATQIYLTDRIPSVVSFSGFDYLNAIFGVDQYPIAYQFWFIRDLMVLVLLAPLIKILLEYLATPFMVLVFIYWFLGVWPVYIPSSVGLLFFSLGAYLATLQKNLFAFDKYGVVLILSYLVIIAFHSLFHSEPFSPYLHRLGTIFGLFAVLSLTKFIARSQQLKSIILWLSNASFFVFATHEPLLTVLKKVAFKLISPETSAMILFLYLALPIMVIIFSVTAYHFLIRVSPKMVSTITGSR